MTADRPDEPGVGRRRFVTIRDVASDAQVGTTTVSRTLNNSGYVADDVRRRVLDSVQRLGYHPSARARSMRNQRSMTIGVVLQELVNPVYLEFLHGVETVAGRAGYVTMVATSHHEAAQERAILDRLVSERVDGVILDRVQTDPRSTQALREQGIPVLPVPGRPRTRPDKAWVATEQAATTRMIHGLLERGHRRVTVVTAADEAPAVPHRSRPPRSQAIEAALAEAGVEPGYVSVRRSGDPEESAAVTADQIAATGPPTAVIVTSHMIAPNVLCALKAAGLRVPTDVSFVTYGDSPWAIAYQPPLSVIRHDTYHEAVELTEMLLEHIAGGSSRRRVAYHAEFVERESIADARRQ